MKMMIFIRKKISSVDVFLNTSVDMFYFYLETEKNYSTKELCYLLDVSLTQWAKSPKRV